MIPGIVAGGANNVPGIVFLNDLPVAPKAVYSLRKLISTATMSVRVRRSTDNAEQDIGFDGDSFDESALTTFAGVGSAYIRTFYDQSGNGFDAVQATNANQPVIYESGVFQGKIKFNGTTNSLSIASLTNGTPYFAVYGNMQAPFTATSEIVIEGSANYSASSQSFLLFTTQDGTGNVWSQNGNNTTTTQRLNQYLLPNFTSLAQLTFLWDRTIVGPTELKAFSGGAAVTRADGGPSDTDMTGNFNTHTVYLGARAGSSLFSELAFETLVFYTADTSVIRTSIEALVA